MPVVNQVITLAEAVNREFDTWDAVIKPFGHVGTGLDPDDDFVYPTLARTGVTAVNPRISLPSVAAVAIGPRSSVDRCWVTWDPQVIVNAAIPPAKVAFPDFFRRLSVQAPLAFGQFGNVNAPTVSQGEQSVNPISALRFGCTPNAFSLSTVQNLDDTGGVYRPDQIIPVSIGSLTPIDFSPATEPQLHLVFYLKPPYQTIPTARFPYEMQQSFIPGTVSPSTIAFGTAFPVFGRRHIRLVLEMTAGSGSYNASVAGLICRNDTNDVPDFPLTASPAGGGAVSTTTTRTLTYDNPNIDYLVIYTQAVSGNPTARATVLAYD